MSSLLISSKEASLEIGCADQTLKQSRVTGSLFGKPAPAYLKIGRTVRYKRNTVETWIGQFPEVSNTAEADHEVV